MVHATVSAKLNSGAKRLQTTAGVWVDDVRLNLMVTEKLWDVVSNAPDDLEIGIEKPGHFMVEHQLGNNTTRFQFQSKASVADHKVSLTLVHHHGLSRPLTTLEAATRCPFVKGNKVTVKHNFAKSGPLVKYQVNWRDFEVEPSVHLGEQCAGAVSVKKEFGEGEHIEAFYRHRQHRAEVEVAKRIGDGGPLTVRAIFDLRDGKAPSFVVEKEWEVSF